MEHPMNNLKQQLSLSIRARYPLIYLVTSEESRAEEALEEVGRSTGKEVIAWSCSKGFQPPQGDAKKSTQPEEALKYIDASDKKAVFVLKDFHPYMEEQKTLRLMRDLVNNLKRSYKTVLLVSPVLKIPPELEKDITVHDMPLPDADELGEVLNNLLEPYRKSQKVKVELTKDLQEKVVQATLGLTRNEAENVYAKALITDRKFSKADLSAVGRSAIRHASMACRNRRVCSCWGCRVAVKVCPPKLSPPNGTCLCSGSTSARFLIRISATLRPICARPSRWPKR
jgi:hypothetical protein